MNLIGIFFFVVGENGNNLIKLDNLKEEFDLKNVKCVQFMSVTLWDTYICITGFSKNFIHNKKYFGLKIDTWRKCISLKIVVFDIEKY